MTLGLARYVRTTTGDLRSQTTSQRSITDVRTIFIGEASTEAQSERYLAELAALAGRPVRAEELVGLEQTTTFRTAQQKLGSQPSASSEIPGAAKLCEFAVEDADQILFEEHCAYLVAWPSGLPLHTLLELGWSGDAWADLEFVNRSAESDALLLKKIGEFDDPERGLVAIGRQPLVNALFS